MINAKQSGLMPKLKQEFFPAVMENHLARMPRPKEVLVYVDETGNVSEESCVNTEMISLYETMKRTLIALAIMDNKKMSDIIMKVLRHIVTLILTIDRREGSIT